MKNKRAQITVFVILALVILIAIGLYFGLREQIVKNQPEVPQPIVSRDVQVVSEFADKCLRDVTKQAIIIAGKNGGYIGDPSGLTINSVQPYNSDVFSNEFYSIPYWYHMKELNHFESNKPALCDYSGDCGIVDFGETSIQKNIENYVEDNIDSCLKGFSQFHDIYDIRAVGEKKINVQILNDTVTSRLNYKLRIKSFNPEDNDVELQDFKAELNVPLLQMFVLATDITQAQIDGAFIENNVLNLINVYSDVDSNYLPPISRIKFFEFGHEFWMRRALEDRMRYEILPFIGLTRFVNVLNSDPPIAHVDPPYQHFAQGFYNSFLVNLGVNKTYPYRVDLFYPDSNIEFYIDNGEELIEPHEFSGMNDKLMKMFKLLIQDYSFKYYLSFPVVVKIHDENAFDGEGYDFFISLESNIRNNIPARGNMSVYNFYSPSRIKIDDPRVLVNKTITIDVNDRHTDEPISDANIFYSCGKDFFVGETNMEGNRAIFIGKLPYCATGGYIKVMKDGYASGIQYFNNLENDETSVSFTIEMWPKHKKRIYLWKRTPEDVNQYLTEGFIVKFTAKHEITYNDSVMFNINRINELQEEDTVPVVGFQLITKQNNSDSILDLESHRASFEELYASGDINESIYDSLIEAIEEYEVDYESFELSQEYYIEVTPGEYEIDTTMMTKGPYNIPEKTEEICTIPEIAGVCLGDTEPVTYPETNLSTWVTGVSKFNATLGENYVYNDKPLHFFVLYKPAPTTWDELTDYDLDDYVHGEPNLEHMMEIFLEI